MNARLLGFGTAVLTLAVDQANKLYLLHVADIEQHQPLHAGPFLDLVLARNPGISYSLLSAHSPRARWLLVLLTALITLAIGAWLWQSATRLSALALGLILGGAVGNLIDRFAYGWVADFYYFHVGSFHWYVFNLADVAIVGGVALLVCDAFLFAGSRRSPQGLG